MSNGSQALFIGLIAEIVVVVVNAAGERGREQGKGREGETGERYHTILTTHFIAYGIFTVVLHKLIRPQ